VPDQIIVFKADLERDVLRLQWGDFEGYEVDIDGLIPADAITGLFFSTINLDRSRPVQVLNLRSRDGFQTSRQKMVETQALIVKFGL